MVFRHYLDTLSNVPLDAEDDEAVDAATRRPDADTAGSPHLATQKQIASILEPFFADGDQGLSRERNE